ncbi:UTRA domain-containing protein [Streptomyces stramineus]
MRLALDVLQAEGRIEKVHGRGNFIRQRRERSVYDSRRHTSDRQASPNPSLEVSVTLNKVKATDALSSFLRVRRGSLLAEYVYVSYLGTSAQSLARLYVPFQVARLGDLETGPSPWGDDVRELLAAAGVQVASTVERVTSRLPSGKEREVLRSTAPVLAMERTSVDANGRVVEGAYLVLPGDRAEAVFATSTHVEPLETA